MKKFSFAELEIVKLDVRDIITTSTLEYGGSETDISGKPGIMFNLTNSGLDNYK